MHSRPLLLRREGLSACCALEDDGSLVGATLTQSMKVVGTARRPRSRRGLCRVGTGVCPFSMGSPRPPTLRPSPHLEQETNALVAIPMAHLLVWYRELVTDVGQRSRIVFATSLPKRDWPRAADLLQPCARHQPDSRQP